MNMILNWLDAKEEADFGNKLAEFYDQKCREIEKGPDHKQEGKRLKSISQLLLQARQFKTSRKLNAYKKAKLGNAFKWKLKDLGYDEELIGLLTKEIMLELQ
jgi:hypothetical protein